ncbi:hypothetical protein [Mesorhizobium cantuariense]|uniref:Uncharacterized protein n=1 Tax=Mesorhizobium cantuariense TaxID=1300275 RepID=A0ABV7MN93_9HYPH
MTAAGLALRLVDNALAELSERADKMSTEVLASELKALAASGRSAVGDLVAGVLDHEFRRRRPAESED